LSSTLRRLTRQRQFQPPILHLAQLGVAVGRIEVEVGLAQVEYSRHQLHVGGQRVAQADVALGGADGGQQLVAVDGIAGGDAALFQAAREAAEGDQPWTEIGSRAHVVQPGLVLGAGRRQAGFLQALAIVGLLQADADLADAAPAPVVGQAAGPLAGAVTGLLAEHEVRWRRGIRRVDRSASQVEHLGAVVAALAVAPAHAQVQVMQTRAFGDRAGEAQLAAGGGVFRRRIDDQAPVRAAVRRQAAQQVGEGAVVVVQRAEDPGPDGPALPCTPGGEAAGVHRGGAEVGPVGPEEAAALDARRQISAGRQVAGRLLVVVGFRAVPERDDLERRRRAPACAQGGIAVA
jgi:hypothetical protein